MKKLNNTRNGVFHFVFPVTQSTSKRFLEHNLHFPALLPFSFTSGRIYLVNAISTYFELDIEMVTDCAGRWQIKI